MKKTIFALAALLTIMLFSGCGENNVEIPRITLVIYRHSSSGTFVPEEGGHGFSVYADDGKIYAVRNDGWSHAGDPDWISLDSDDWYERMTEFADNGEPVGDVPDEIRKLIRENCGRFSKWSGLKLRDHGVIFDYTDRNELYGVYKGSDGSMRAVKIAEVSTEPVCLDSAEAVEFANGVLGKWFG